MIPCRLGTHKPGFLLLCVFIMVVQVAAWINYSPTGSATLTHYDLPRDYVASCGCMPASTHYPTAALSQMAYGSSTAFGPACGKCFNLTLLNPVYANPPFHPPSTRSIVVKITDLCPLSKGGWCSGTETKTDPAGQYLNFDLAFPSQAIPTDFFPSDLKLYGYTDFGVWNITYQTVACQPNWAGSNDSAALGSVTNLGQESVCCPANLATGNPNDTCPSYSDQNGIPPNTATSNARSLTFFRSVIHSTIYIALLRCMYWITCL